MTFCDSVCVMFSCFNAFCTNPNPNPNPNRFAHFGLHASTSAHIWESRNPPAGAQVQLEVPTGVLLQHLLHPPPLRPGWGPQGPKGGATQGRAGQGRAAQGTRGRCGGTCQGGQRADLPPLHHQRQPEHNCACRLWAFRWSKQSISPGAVGIAGRGGGGGGGDGGGAKVRDGLCAGAQWTGPCISYQAIQR